MVPNVAATAALLAACAVLRPAPAAPTQGDAPAPGRLLVARPHIEGPFAESVVLLLAHGEEGSLGLVINRPTDVTLAALLPDVKALGGRSDRAFAGGPVGQDHLHLLLGGTSAPAGAEAVLDGVWWSDRLESLEAALAHEAAPFRAYVGYAGWAPHQLDAELALGAWWVTDADAAAVFADDPAALWPAQVRALQGLHVRGPLRLARLPLRAHSPSPPRAPSSTRRSG